MLVGRLLGGEVIILAVDEQHNVGVLLDRAGLAKVGQLRALVLALLDGAAELGQGQHRHVQLLGQRLQAPADLRNLLDAVAVPALPEPVSSWR
jgi:hypothetical protein